MTPALEDMLHEAHRVHVYHSQREGLSVGQSSSSMSERTGRSVGEQTGRPVRPSGQELNVAIAQIRTLLDRQRQKRCTKTRWNYWIPARRTSFERLLQQNSELREAHYKSLNEMEELKKFQSFTFDTIARRRLVEDQDTILELTGKIQELPNEINCMNWLKRFSGCWIQFAVEIPTLPVDQCLSHLIQFLEEC